MTSYFSPLRTSLTLETYIQARCTICTYLSMQTVTVSQKIKTIALSLLKITTKINAKTTMPF